MTMTALELRERARTALAAGHWAEADLAAWESMEIFAREDGPDTQEVAALCNLLAQIAEAKSEFAVAETHARRAWAIMARLGDRGRAPEADAIRVEARLRLGTALHGAGRYREAESWLTQALALAEVTGRGLAAALTRLGVLSQSIGNFVKAERFYRRALKMVPEDSADAATLHYHLASMAHAQGSFGAGEEHARLAWEIRRELRGANHPATQAAACAYAALAQHPGRRDRAERIYRRALACFEQAFGPDHIEVALTLRQLAGTLAARGEMGEAEALYRRAAAIQESVLGGSHAETARTWHYYASLLADLGRVAEARRLASRALQVFEVEFAASHPWRLASIGLWRRLGRSRTFNGVAGALSSCEGPLTGELVHV